MTQGSAIRNLLVNIGVKADNTKDLMLIEDRIAGISEGFRQLQAAVMKAGLVLAGVTTGIVVSTHKLGTEANRIATAAQNVGLSVEHYQAYERAMKSVGGTAEQTESMIAKVALRVQEANDGSKNAVKVFRSLGISLGEMGGLDSVGKFERVRAALAGLTSDQERLVAVQRIWGEDMARRVMPMVSATSRSVWDLTAAEEENLVMTSAQIKAAQTMADGYTRLQKILESLRNRLSMGLVPVVVRFQGVIERWYRANASIIKQGIDNTVRRVGDAYEWLAVQLKDVADAAGGLEGVIQLTKYLAIATAVLAGGKMVFWLKGVAAGIGIFIKGLTVVAAKVMLVVGVVALLVLGLAAMIDDIRTFRKGGESIFGKILEGEEFEYVRAGFRMVEAAMDHLSGVFKSVKEDFTTYLMPVFKRQAPAMIGAFTVVVGVFAGVLALLIGLLMRLGLGAATAFAAILTMAEDYLEPVVAFIEKMINTWVEFIDAIKRTPEAIKIGFVEAKEKAQGAVNRFVGPIRATASAVQQDPGGLWGKARQNWSGDVAQDRRTLLQATQPAPRVDVQATFNVQGSDPKAIAHEVAKQQKALTQDALKQAGGRYTNGGL